jgi:molybdopterin biosynthesis enzyme
MYTRPRGRARPHRRAHGRLLAKDGVALVVVPHLPKTYLDGAALKLGDGTPVVGLTLRYDLPRR